MPPTWTDVERKELRANVAAIAREYDNAEEEFEGLIDAAYEGRRGASPREILVILYEAAQDSDMPCLSPLAALKAIRGLGEDASLYEFLRLPSEAGYGDVERLTDAVESEYRRIVRDEVHRAVALVKEGAYDDLFHDYFKHMKASDAGEKIRNPITNQLDDPNERLMHKIETLMDFEGEAAEFRKNLIVRIAAWVIDHPEQEVDYEALFPRYIEQLRQAYFDDRRGQVGEIGQAIVAMLEDDDTLVLP